MLLLFLRVIFAMMVIAIGLSYAEAVREHINPTHVYFGSVLLAGAVVCLEWFVPRKSLAAMAGLFFGLIVGMVITFGLSLVLELFADVYPALDSPALLATIKLLVGVTTCYVCVSFILQTREDIRFVIPYVEFARQVKGQRPMILDTSVIIDGRIADVCETWPVDQKVIVPRFVLQELQDVADSTDKLKRNRGRRGLDVLKRLQSSHRVDVQILEGGLTKIEQTGTVDQMLLSLAHHLNGRVVTVDYNLNKVGQVSGVEIININDLANAIKPVVLPGERLEVKILRPGQEPGQGVGYRDDGTMVVVEGGREYIGQRVLISVTSALQTSAGRMLFGRLEEAEPRGAREGVRGGTPAV